MGVGGWTNAMNVLDIGSTAKMCYPTVSRDADDCRLRLLEFALCSLALA